MRPGYGTNLYRYILSSDSSLRYYPLLCYHRGVYRCTRNYDENDDDDDPHLHFSQVQGCDCYQDRWSLGANATRT